MKGCLEKAYDSIGNYTRFFNQHLVNFSNMKPRGDLSSTGLCTAHDGLEYAIYTPNAQSFALDLSKVKGKIVYEWFNPSTDTIFGRSDFEGAEKLILRAPGVNDWVLHMKK